MLDKGCGVVSTASNCHIFEMPSLVELAMQYFNIRQDGRQEATLALFMW